MATLQCSTPHLDSLDISLEEEMEVAEDEEVAVAAVAVAAALDAAAAIRAGVVVQCRRKESKKGNQWQRCSRPPHYHPKLKQTQIYTHGNTP